MFGRDRRLVDRCVRGDKTALDELYDRHAVRVFNLLARLSCSRSLAEDLTQETFVAAYRSLSSWRGEGAFSTWLCGIACRQHSNLRRRSLRDETCELSDAMETFTPSADPLAHYAMQDNVRRMERAIEHLPDLLREVFVLVKVEGFTYREAAKCLDLPIGTVQSRLWRAVHGLQAALSEDCEIDGLQTAAGTAVPSGGKCNEL